MSENNFWKKLKLPVFVLAPMADVTDAAFRRIIAKYSKFGGAEIFDKDGKFTRHNAELLGGPDVMWTEFVSADGLVRATPEGKKKLLKDLEYTEAERPIVAQLFGANIEYMEEAARLAESLRFDGLDINMGCPDKSIEKQGAGAAMIKNPEKAREIIRAAKRGAPSLPISVKTRVGFNKVELEEWLPILLSENISALTIHARTRKEMSKVPANWDHVKRAVEIRNEMQKETLIIGNGDVKNLEEARARIIETGCDGVMIGRGIFGFPWRFRKDNYEPTIEERLNVLVEHSKLFDELLGTTKNFAIMKKHFKAYVNNFDGSAELRMKLMETENASQVEVLINDFLKTL